LSSSSTPTSIPTTNLNLPHNIYHENCMETKQHWKLACLELLIPSPWATSLDKENLLQQLGIFVAVFWQAHLHRATTHACCGLKFTYMQAAGCCSKQLVTESGKIGPHQMRSWC
jgi:hypothetical protein